MGWNSQRKARELLRLLAATFKPALSSIARRPALGFARAWPHYSEWRRLRIELRSAARTTEAVHRQVESHRSRPNESQCQCRWLRRSHECLGLAGMYRHRWPEFAER